MTFMHNSISRQRIRLSCRPGSRFLILAALVLAPLSVRPGSAQVVPLDDAVFVLERRGEVIGEERITLHRLGLGEEARVIGQSEITLADGTEMRPRLEASGDLRATTYQNSYTGPESGEILVSRAGRRLVARTRTAAGEAQREYRASDRTVILEPEVTLLYYFVTPWIGEDGAELLVLEPRSGRQTTVRLHQVGRESYRLGRDEMDALHLRLTPAEAGASSRDAALAEVWIDDQGRLLRIDVPETGYSSRRSPD